MSLPRFRRFTLVTQSDPIEADGLHYLEVDVFEDDRLVGRLDLDESWFKTLNVSIRRDWSDSNALLTTFPSDWLESLDFEKPPDGSVLYFYVARKLGGDSLHPRRPTMEQLHQSLLDK